MPIAPKIGYWMTAESPPQRLNETRHIHLPEARHRDAGAIEEMARPSNPR
jgi:hypothetical protein